MLITVTATATAAAIVPAERMFPDIRMVTDFVMRSNGQLALKASDGSAASVEIVLPCAVQD